MAAEFKLSSIDVSSISNTLNLVIAHVDITGNCPERSNTLLDAYSAFISNDMLQGQNRVDKANQQYRISSFALNWDQNVIVQPAKTALESFYNASVQSADVPANLSGIGWGARSQNQQH
jgi:hypothetical protein